MRTSEQINELATALAKAQAAMQPAVKDAVNPAFRSKYADLAAVWDACRKPLTSNGIATMQDVEATEAGIAVTTRLVHTSGQWVEFGPLVVPLTKRDAHGVGSATSYGKRYGLSAAVGIVSDDDDGNGAVGRTNGRAEQPIEAGGFIEADAMPTPPGYDDWFDDMSAKASEGLDALEAAWKTSSMDYKRYLTKTNPAAWDTMKRTARKALAGARA